MSALGSFPPRERLVKEHTFIDIITQVMTGSYFTDVKWNNKWLKILLTKNICCQIYSLIDIFEQIAVVQLE